MDALTAIHVNCCCCCFLLCQNAHMRHASPPHAVGQMSPHPMHGHMMPQMGPVSSQNLSVLWILVCRRALSDDPVEKIMFVRFQNVRFCINWSERWLPSKNTGTGGWGLLNVQICSTRLKLLAILFQIDCIFTVFRAWFFVKWMIWGYLMYSITKKVDVLWSKFEHLFMSAIGKKTHANKMSRTHLQCLLVSSLLKNFV